MSAIAACTCPAILRYTAFTDTPDGGNPAGVVLDASALSATREMQQIAADLGYSESAFVTARDDGGYDVRYFSPRGRSRSAGTRRSPPAVALAERDGAGPLTFHTQAGVVPVATQGTNGAVTATLTSVVPHVEDAPADLLDAALDSAALERGRPRPGAPAQVSYAGARHLILAAATRERLADLDYDFEALKAIMHAHDLDDGRPRPPRGRDAPSTPATRSRSAASSRTRRPARRPPRSAPTCASWS